MSKADDGSGAAGENGPARDRALTLDRRRQAGSPVCLNCGTRLEGPFCYYCGQPDRNFLRFFPVLLRELLEDFLDLDSRFARTLKPLLFKPGRLTRDYLEGRRYRYTPPLRMYLFSSIAFFVLAAFLSVNAIDIQVSDSQETGKVISFGTKSGVDEERLQEALADLSPGLRVQVEEAIRQNTEPEGTEQDFFGDEGITVNGEPWDAETNPVDIAWLPDWLNAWVNREIAESPAKAERIQEDPGIIVEQVFELLPGTMFVLLPVVALIFKFWYPFARRYYIEHLIFALHNHAFIFLSLILLLLLNLLESWVNESGLEPLAGAFDWLSLLIGIWIPVYLLVSLKHVYGQGWLMTLGKYAGIGISYLTLLSFVTSGVAILGFVLL